MNNAPADLQSAGKKLPADYKSTGANRRGNALIPERVEKWMRCRLQICTSRASNIGEIMQLHIGFGHLNIVLKFEL